MRKGLRFLLEYVGLLIGLITFSLISIIGFIYVADGVSTEVSEGHWTMVLAYLVLGVIVMFVQVGLMVILDKI